MVPNLGYRSDNLQGRMGRQSGTVKPFGKPGVSGRRRPGAPATPEGSGVAAKAPRPSSRRRFGRGRGANPRARLAAATNPTGSGPHVRDQAGLRSARNGSLTVRLAHSAASQARIETP